MMEPGVETATKYCFSDNYAFGVLDVFSFSLLILFFGWFFYRWTLFNCRSFPPGPIGLPVVGHAGVLIREPHLELNELGKKYGKIFSLYFGTAYTVATADYEVAKELVSHPFTLARPQDVFGFIPGRGGFAGSSGAEWQEQRRFCASTMRNLRMGKGLWEKMIQAHVADFVEEVSIWRAKPTYAGESVILSVCCTNLALLIGRRLSKKTSPDALHLMKKTIVILAEHFGASFFTVAMPWLLQYLERFRIGHYAKQAQVLDEFAHFIRKEIQRHVDSKDLGDENLIGSYLKEMEKQNATNNRHYFSVDNLLGHLILLFFASSDTTSSSLNWLLLLIVTHPEVQKKVHQEIDDVIGRNGQLTWDERKNFPYTMAVILEMERFATINRIFPPRISTGSFECRGYTIPKGSRILVDSWAIMHDPVRWDNPMKFIPERFIRNDGKDPYKSAGLSAFSFGRRNCPGDVIGLMTIFIYFTAIMQKFRITPPPGGKVDLIEGPSYAVCNPVEQLVCFIERERE